MRAHLCQANERSCQGNAVRPGGGLGQGRTDGFEQLGRRQQACTIEALERAGAHISGVVLNRVKPRPHDDYYYVRDEAEDAPGMDNPLPRRHAKASSGW